MRQKNEYAVLTFAQAAALISRRFGFKPNVSTVWRWAKKGIDGRFLEVIRIGRRYRTTPDAVERFVKQIPPAGGTTAHHSPKARPDAPTGFSKPQRTAARASIAREVEESKSRLSRYRRQRNLRGKEGAA